MSKLDELIAAIKQLSEMPKNNCACMTTGMICKTIVAVVGIIAAALLLWYLFKRVADGIKWLADGHRERKDAKKENCNNEGQREKSLEKERLVALRKEYQMKALKYIEDRKREDKTVSFEKDEYLARVDEYLGKINSEIEKLQAVTSIQNKKTNILVQDGQTI